MHPVPGVVSATVEITAVHMTVMKMLVNNELNFLIIVEDYSMKSMLKTEEISSLFMTFAYNIAYALI
jgi:hypothetical protein